MRPATKSARLGVLMLFLGALGACDSLGPEDQGGSGSLTVSLLSPNGAEGSAVFELTGGVGLSTVSPIGGEVLYQHFGGSSRVVVVMDDPGVVSFIVRTDDVQELPEVNLIQVASGANELRGSLEGYTVEFSAEKDSSKKGRGG
jgi:hypothetical protein